MPVAERRAQGRARAARSSTKKGHRVVAGRRSRAARSPGRSGARPGATTSSATATTRTACRAAAPTCATARWSTCRSRRARCARCVSGSELYRVEVDGRRRAEGALDGRLHGLRRRDRLAGRAAAGALLAGRDGAHLPADDRALSRRRRRSASRAAAPTGRRCASTSRPCSTASARGSTSSPSCSSRCARSTSRISSPRRARAWRGPGKDRSAGKVLGDRRSVGDVRDRDRATREAASRARRQEASVTRAEPSVTHVMADTFCDR